MSVTEYCKSQGVLFSEVLAKSREAAVCSVRRELCFLLWKNGFEQEYIAGKLNLSQSGVSRHISNFS